jgi:hypothetical protein
LITTLPVLYKLFFSKKAPIQPPQELERKQEQERKS